MTRKMKGGSVASDAVVELVKPEAFSKLDAQFDNLVGGAKKSAPRKSAQSKAPTAKPKAAAKKQKGGICAMCGGHMKHMNDFDDDGLFNLYNKKGGAAPLYEVKYDYDASMAKPAHGLAVDRVLDQGTVALMATESPSSLGSMSKMVQYGNVFDGNNIAFNYSSTGGAMKKKVPAAPKAKKSTKAPAKPKAAPKAKVASSKKAVKK